MPLLGVELEPVLVSFGRFYDIFAIFFNYATFFVGDIFLPSFWWCDIFVIFNFVWGFLSSFEATTFLPFSGISYIRGEENFGLEFAKILS